MSKQLRDTIYQELSAVSIIDPHTHINALNPASDTLADILGYHYYTELAHSAGMPKADIEEPGLDPKEKVGRLMANLGPINNTIQYSWFVEMAQELLGFEGDEINAENWEPLYDHAAQKMASDGWADEVLRASKLDGVFLTNDFDDPLEGFDTKVYIPCLRTDDLVFHLAKSEVRERFESATGQSTNTIASLSAGIGKLFDHFAGKGAKACAISLPPDFAPAPVSVARAETALAAIHSDGVEAAESHRRAIANFVFWSLAQRCSDYRLPFDLMIGVNRGVYAEGVFQGQDLYDSRVSLIQYKQLFNAFPEVTFPISVLASVTNQELVSYSWIFPNVAVNGHWWYSNTPTYIEHDASARLEAVPRTKQIGYYSDMYKLEFALPKFNMYKRILAKILAERFVVDRGWSESRAVEFGLQVLRDNSEQIFKVGRHDEPPYLPPPELTTVTTDEPAEEKAVEETVDSAAMVSSVMPEVFEDTGAITIDESQGDAGTEAVFDLDEPQDVGAEAAAPIPEAVDLFDMDRAEPVEFGEGIDIGDGLDINDPVAETGDASPLDNFPDLDVASDAPSEGEVSSTDDSAKAREPADEEDDPDQFKLDL